VTAARPPLPVIVTCGERAVCHAVDPDLPAGELAAALRLYLGPPGALLAPGGPVTPVWRAAEGPRPLDPALPLGAQVPPEAEIDFPLFA
jgi:hypothetical protein